MRIVRLFILLFLSAYSLVLSAQKIKVSIASNITEINEICGLLNNEKIQFKLDSVAKTNRLYLIQFKGTATRGSDYATNTPDSLKFAIGDSVKSFDLAVFNDGLEEGQEEILVITTGTIGADTLRIKINDHIFKILGNQDSFSQCSNEPFTVSVQSVTGASLSWNSTDMVKNGSKPGDYIISPIRSTKLILTGQLFNCIERDTITINSQPIGVTLNTKDTLFLCFPDSSRLIANITPSNATIVWSPLDNTTRVINNTTIQVKPPKSATYYVNVSSGLCKAADTVYVSMDSLRDTKITIFPKKDKYCKGDSIFFFSQRHPKDLFPAIKPSWNPSNGFQTSKDTLNAVIMADKTTTYIRVTQNNACKHTDSAYIKVVEPSIPVGPVDTTVCPGKTIQLNFKPDTSSYKEFKWTPQDGLISCEKCPDPKIKVNGDQMYKVEAKKDGCDATTEISTHVFQKPAVRIATDLPPPINAGSNVKINLLGTTGLKAFTWTVDGKAVPANALIYAIDKIAAGNHTVIVNVTDSHGCLWDYSFTIVVICPPSGVTLTRIPTGVVYEGTNLAISSVGVPVGSTNIKWSVNGSTVSGNTNILQDKPNKAGTVVYRFDATDPNGCPISASISVQVIPCISPEELKKKIPNAFTPNGDQKNDYFTYSDGALKITNLVIYSRWGQLVYNNTDPANGWNGKIGNSDAASDVYIYRMTYICGDGAPQDVTGTVTLLR
ncbi:MAG: gliding motility-associated C-terminal domain-containing protein [Saprospiraceae bacterium]